MRWEIKMEINGRKRQKLERRKCRWCNQQFNTRRNLSVKGNRKQKWSIERVFWGGWKGHREILQLILQWGISFETENEIRTVSGTREGCPWSSWIMQGSKPRQQGAKVNQRWGGGRRERGGQGGSNPDMVSFLLENSSMSPRHVELLHNMISRWSTQAQMCVSECVSVCARLFVCQSERQRERH